MGSIPRFNQSFFLKPTSSYSNGSILVTRVSNTCKLLFIFPAFLREGVILFVMFRSYKLKHSCPAWHKTGSIGTVISAMRQQSQHAVTPLIKKFKIGAKPLTWRIAMQWVLRMASTFLERLASLMLTSSASSSMSGGLCSLGSGSFGCRFICWKVKHILQSRETLARKKCFVLDNWLEPRTVVLACLSLVLDGFVWHFQATVHTLSSAVNKSQRLQKTSGNAGNQTRGCWVRRANATSVLCSPPPPSYRLFGSMDAGYLCAF